MRIASLFWPLLLAFVLLQALMHRINAWAEISRIASLLLSRLQITLLLAAYVLLGVFLSVLLSSLWTWLFGV